MTASLQSSDTPQRTRWHVRAAASGFLVSAVGPLPAFLIGAQAVQVMAELGFDEAGLGLALTAFFGAGGIASTRSGRIADRIGWHRAVMVTASGAILTSLVVASSARTLTSLVVALCIGGVVFSFAIPTGNLVLAAVLPRDRFATAFGLKSATIGIGTVLAGLAVPAMALTIGWRWSFSIGAVLAFVAVVLAPADVPGRRTASPDVPRSQGSRGSLLLLAAAGGAATITVGALSAFLVVSSVRAGLRPAVAGLLMSAANAVGITTNIVGGVLADRYGSRGLRPVAAMLATGVVGYVLLATRVPSLIVAGAFLAFGAGWGWPGLYHYGVVLHFPERPGAASGVVQAGLSAGMAVGPLTFGAIGTRAGYGVLWASVGAVAAIAAALVLVSLRRLPDPWDQVAPQRPRAALEGG